MHQVLVFCSNPQVSDWISRMYVSVQDVQCW